MDSKRNDIIEQVKHLYLEFGIKSVTMDDVSHKLGISKKTLYECFTDKKQLVQHVITSMIESPNTFYTVRMPEGLNALEELLYYYHVQAKMIDDYKPSFIYDLKKYYPRLFDFLNREKRTRFIQVVMANLKKGKEEGLFRAEIDEDIITRLTLMRMECILTSDLFTENSKPNAQTFKEIFRFHLYGIVSDKGRELLEKNIDQLNQ